MTALSYARGETSPPLLTNTVSVALRTISPRHPDADAVVSVQQDPRLTSSELDGAVDRLRGRSVLEPEAWSTKTRAQPARSSASSCSCGFWSTVETRA